MYSIAQSRLIRIQRSQFSIDVRFSSKPPARAMALCRAMTDEPTMTFRTVSRS